MSSILFLGGCMNPMGSIKGDIKEFKERYPKQIIDTKTPQHSLRYVWAGDPKLRPIIFVHGSPGSWEAWAHFLLNDQLTSKYHVIAVDRPGYGGSGPGVTEKSLVTQAAVAMAALEDNKSNLPAILVGHSYGGPVVAQMAISYPEKVAGVVFVASSVDPNLEKTKWFQYPAGWWPLDVMLPSALRVCNEEIRALKGELTRMAGEWSRYRARTVILQGTEDDLVSPKNSDFLESKIDKKYLLKSLRIEGLNHFVPWKRPDLIFDGIAQVDPGISLKQGVQ